MKWKTMAPLAVCLGSVACGTGAEDDAVEARSRALATGEVFKIGVLLDDTSPAKANFAAAANLAASQLNQGLASAGSAHSFDLVVVNYVAGQEQDVAIDLVNNQGVLGLVTDTDNTTAVVNRLNHEFVPRINYEVPVTCHQCASSRFHRVDEADPGYADPDRWLFRTFFNALFESSLQVRFVMRRQHQGDFNRDGHLKIVVFADSANDNESSEVEQALNRLHAGSHSVERVLKSNNLGEPPIAASLDEVFDDQVPPGVPDRFPDAVYLNMHPRNAVVVLQAVRDYPLANKPPIAASETFRRDYYLPSSAAIWEGLEGSSPLKIASSSSGPMFRSAYVAATGSQPEFTASFLYDAVVMHGLAISWAFHFGSTDTAVIQGNFPNVNDPSGRVIRPRPMDFKLAAQRINQDRPINYEGASSSMDLDVSQDNNPDLVRWKVQNGKFVEHEVYICNADIPDCRRR